MKRQAATPKGFERRVQDLELYQVTEPRQSAKVTIPLPTLLVALVAAMVTRARSLRMAEQRTAAIARKQGAWLGLERRIADNSFGKVLPKLCFGSVLSCLHRLVKAEHRRGNLEPSRLKVATVAIDGKNVGTLHWRDLCRVLKLEAQEASAAQVKERLGEQYPQAQLCIAKDGEPYALMRVHTVTLVSSESAPCIHLRPIAGSTNEIGSMPELLDELQVVYGRSRLFGRITTDAGNTSLAAMSKVVQHGWHYFAQIKSEHGDLYAEAERLLGHRRHQRSHANYSDTQNGKVVTYHLWRYDLTEQGWLHWTHARQLVRVQRIAEDPATGNKSVGNRYYVSSETPAALEARPALRVSRAHWRCEDETHWTADAQMQEDRRRLAWSRHPNGILVVSVLRMIAIAILAVARKLSRLGYSLEIPSWSQVAEHFLLQLCGGILDTKAFDTV
ncbi:MAG: ISAs1 family transposase [Thermoanaerobaculaceae bacterium]|nr:ISAs1 family transposase [Thermoanaerobaculaceae bacterium]